jgi:ABC-2 type transport system ATP-binding protein
VLLTTHYMFEADSLCDRVAVIAKGRLVAQGTPRDLKARVADRTEVEIQAFGVGEDAIGRVEVREPTLEDAYVDLVTEA